MELWAEGPTCALWPVAWHLESGGLETSLSHCKVTYSGSYGMCGWLACPFDTLNCRSVVIEKVFNFTHAPLILNGNEPACVKLKSFTTHLQFSVKPPAIMLLHTANDDIHEVTNCCTYRTKTLSPLAFWVNGQLPGYWASRQLESVGTAWSWGGG